MVSSSCNVFLSLDHEVVQPWDMVVRETGVESTLTVHAKQNVDVYRTGIKSRVIANANGNIKVHGTGVELTVGVHADQDAYVNG